MDIYKRYTVREGTSLRASTNALGEFLHLLRTAVAPEDGVRRLVGHIPIQLWHRVGGEDFRLLLGREDILLDRTGLAVGDVDEGTDHVHVLVVLTVDERALVGLPGVDHTHLAVDDDGGLDWAATHANASITIITAGDESPVGGESSELAAVVDNGLVDGHIQVVLIIRGLNALRQNQEDPVSEEDLCANIPVVENGPTAGAIGAHNGAADGDIHVRLAHLCQELHGSVLITEVDGRIDVQCGLEGRRRQVEGASEELLDTLGGRENLDALVDVALGDVDDDVEEVLVLVGDDGVGGDGDGDLSIVNSQGNVHQGSCSLGDERSLRPRRST